MQQAWVCRRTVWALVVGVWCVSRMLNTPWVMGGVDWRKHVEFFNGALWLCFRWCFWGASILSVLLRGRVLVRVPGWVFFQLKLELKSLCSCLWVSCVHPVSRCTFSNEISAAFHKTLHTAKINTCIHSILVLLYKGHKLDYRLTYPRK